MRGGQIHIVKPSPVPSLERRLHQKFDIATVRPSLKTNNANNLLVGGAGMVFQDEVVFQYGKIGRNPEKGLTVDKYDNLKDRIRIQMD
jgi:hypothetical protein